MPAGIYELVIEQRPAEWDPLLKGMEYADDLISFFETLVTEFPNSVERCTSLPTSWDESYSFGLIPGWVYSIGPLPIGGGGPSNIADRVFGSIEFRVGNTDLCYVVACDPYEKSVLQPDGQYVYVTFYDNIYVTIYINNHVVSAYYKLISFIDDSYRDQYGLEPGDLLQVAVAEKYDYYYAIRVIPNVDYSDPGSYPVIVFRLENTIATDDDCWCVCSYVNPSVNGQVKAFFDAPYESESFTLSKQVISPSRVGDLEPDGFIYNRYSNKVPLWPIVGGTTNYGLRGWTNNVVAPPNTFVVSEEIYNIDGESYFGFHNVWGGPLNCNDLLIKL